MTSAQGAGEVTLEGGTSWLDEIGLRGRTFPLRLATAVKQLMNWGQLTEEEGKLIVHAGVNPYEGTATATPGKVIPRVFRWREPPPLQVPEIFRDSLYDVGFLRLGLKYGRLPLADYAADPSKFPDIEATLEATLILPEYLDLLTRAATSITFQSQLADRYGEDSSLPDVAEDPLSWCLFLDSKHRPRAVPIERLNAALAELQIPKVRMHTVPIAQPAKPAKKKYNRLAFAALASAAVPYVYEFDALFQTLGAILSVIALNNWKPRLDKGRWIAVIALIMSLHKALPYFTLYLSEY